MDNVVNFSSYVKPTEEVEILVELVEEDPIQDFLLEYFLPWAEKYGIDINSKEFKLQGAVVVTCLKGILNDAFS